MGVAAEAELLLKLRDETQKGFEAVMGNLKQMQKESKDTEKEVGALGKSFAAFGSGLAGGFGIGLGMMTAQKAGEALASTLTALPNLIANTTSRVMELGGKMSDLSAKTGNGVEALQKLKYAGGQAGVGLETITGAATKMQKALVDTPEKFERIGLSAAQLRQHPIEKQFEAISTQLRGIKDPAERATAAMEIFGKSGAEMLPLLTSNMGLLMQEAERLGLVLGKDVVGAADDLGDTLDTLSQVWEGLTNNIGAAVVTSEPLHLLLQGLVDILGTLSKSVADNRDGMRSLVDSGVILLAKGLLFLVDAVQLGMDAWDSLKLVWLSLINVALQLEHGFASLMLWQAKWKGDQSAIDYYQSSLLQLNKAIEDNAKEAEKTVASNTKATDAIQQVRQQVAGLVTQMEAARGKTHEARKETEQHTVTLGKSAKEMDRLAKEEANRQKEAEKATKERIKAENAAQKEYADILLAMARDADRLRKEEESAAADRSKRMDDWRKQLEDIDRIANEQILATFAANRQAVSEFGAALSAAGEEIGGFFGSILSLGGGAAQVLVNLGEHADRTAERSLTAAEKISAAAGAMQAGIGAFKSGSLLGGAAQGAAAGAAFGGIGAVIGGLAGGLLGLFGKAEKARKELEKLRGEVLQQYGGMENLRKAAASVGVDIEKAFSTKKPEEAKRIFNELEEALEKKKVRLEGIKTAMGGLELMTKGWAAQVERAGGASASTQASFTRLGAFAVATFGAMVKDTGDVIGALQQISPTLDTLAQGMQQFGFQASGAFANLLHLRDVVAGNQDVADSITGLAQLMKGLGDAGLITKDILLQMGAQARANFDELIARGVDANTAMALMQPTLQELWEQQKKLGTTYDENTQSLLDQAEAQGLVGDQFLDVNEQILEVLKLVAETLGATLPDSLRRMGAAADEEFNRMTDAANRAGDAAARAGAGGRLGGSQEAEGSFATGIREVPRTMVARLHAGEEVVPASDRAARRSGGGAPVIVLQSAPVILDGRMVGQQLQRRIDTGDMRAKSPLRRAG